MGSLAANECYRAIKPVEIGPVLSVLDRLAFIAVGQSSPDKYKCDVVLACHFPPQLQALVAGLGLGGRVARALLRRLAPYQCIPPHVDAWMPAEADWRRFQLPITTHPDIIMAWPGDGVEVHLEAGTLYEVRYDRKHEVVHGANCPRIHLQIDQVEATV